MHCRISDDVLASTHANAHLLVPVHALYLQSLPVRMNPRRLHDGRALASLLNRGLLLITLLDGLVPIVMIT
jgi:hypothetical protein